MELTADERNITERVRVRTLRTRRRRLWRTGITFLVVAGGMTVLALANRDAQMLREARADAEYAAQRMQAEYEKTRRVPRTIPGRDERAGRIRSRYTFNPPVLYALRAARTGPLGACCQTRPMRFFFRDDSRFVVLFDGQTFAAHHLSEDDFQARASRLGFSALRNR